VVGSERSAWLVRDGVLYGCEDLQSADLVRADGIAELGVEPGTLGRAMRSLGVAFGVGYPCWGATLRGASLVVSRMESARVGVYMSALSWDADEVRSAGFASAGVAGLGRWQSEVGR